MSATAESVASRSRYPALRSRDFILLTVGRLCGTIGAQMLVVGIGWHVYDLTHDAFALGMVGLCQFLPGLMMVLHAGQVADQVDRRKVLAGTFLLATCCAIALWALTVGGNQQVWPIYVVAGFLGLVRIFGAPAAQALLPNLVPSSAFGNAVALNAAAYQIATIGGPALGGFIYQFGAAAVYGGATIMLALAAGSNALIRTRSHGGKRPLDWQNLVAGVKFIRARPIMLGAISLDLFAVLFGGVIALLPIFARDILHVGPQGLGFLRGAPALGAVVMAFTLAHFPLGRHVGFWLFFSVAIFGLATIGFGLSTSFLLSLALLVVLGGADMISVYVRSHLAQMQTPDDMRGRVASVNMLFITASNELGEFESGVTAACFGAVGATVLGGVLTLAVVALCAWRIPALRRIDRLKDVAMTQDVAV